MKQQEAKQVEFYAVDCGHCEGPVNFTSQNRFPLKLKCPHCGCGLKIEKAENDPFVVTLLSAKR